MNSTSRWPSNHVQEIQEPVSDRAYVIKKGRIRYEGTMEDLVADEEARQAYLTV